MIDNAPNESSFDSILLQTENRQMDRTKVGRYEKLEKIGEGTYGTVFKGTAPDGSLGIRSRKVFSKQIMKTE